MFFTGDIVSGKFWKSEKLTFTRRSKRSLKRKKIKIKKEYHKDKKKMSQSKRKVAQ